MRVKIRFTEPLLGAVPKDPEVYKSYIATKAPKPEEAEAEAVDVQATEEKGWTGFLADEGGLFIYDYVIKGFLKHAGNVLKENVRVKNLRSKIDDLVFIFPRKIHLGKDKADGVLERPLRAMTLQGPRVTLARSDTVNAGTEIEFDITIIQNKGEKSEITEDLIWTLLDYGKFMGLGQFRNGSYGRFEIVR